jgi:hypothetical protein
MAKTALPLQVGHDSLLVVSDHVTERHAMTLVVSGKLQNAERARP